MTLGTGTGKGGTFCRFTVGPTAKGASARHLRYIASPSAVRDGQADVWLKGFPLTLTAAPYATMVRTLCQTAGVLEREDIIGHKGTRRCRTHYQAILSFETPVSSKQAKQMLAEWMEEAFPKARAAAFLHRNTRRLHLQVWIAARQTDGRKINLSAQEFRRLDERWNAIYCRAANREEREHLLKKGETERYKQLRREDKTRSIQKPARAGDRWKKQFFNDRERERLGEGTDDNHQKRTRRDQRTLARQAPEDQGQERGAAKRARLPAAAAQDVHDAHYAAERAVSEALRLYRDAQRLAEPAREPIPALDIEREE